MAVLSSLDISWQGSHKRRGKPLGFRNLGNTCYLNSVLQCLTYTPPLANLCLRHLHSSQCEQNNVACPFCLLETRISRSLNNEILVDAPQKIYRCLQNFAKHFRPGRQEDAHELLRYAIDACDDVCVQLEKRKLNGPPKGELQTVMKEIFGGYLLSQIRCLSCSSVSSKVDIVMDLSLEILHLKTLKEAIAKFFQPETLDGNNKYQCENCKKLSVARKQMSVHQAPNVLAIQLKRFENVFGGKIDAHVEFDEKLKLRAYMSKASQDSQPDYSLYAVVVHSGFSQYGGHYYAYVKDPSGQWFCCNDSFVSAVDIRTVLAERVYILFYVRDFRRPSSLPALIEETGIPSASSTPSPPTTPDSATMAKPLAESNALRPSYGQQEGPKLKFSLVRPGTKLITSNPRVEPKPSSGAEEAPQPLARISDGAAGLDPAPASSPTNSQDSVDHRQRLEAPLKRKASEVSEDDHRAKQLRSSFEDRITEIRSSSDFQKLVSSLEADAREHLKNSGWCDDVRECYRACAKESESLNDPDFREKLISSKKQKLLPLLPSAMKGHLLQVLDDFYQTRVL